MTATSTTPVNEELSVDWNQRFAAANDKRQRNEATMHIMNPKPVIPADETFDQKMDRQLAEIKEDFKREDRVFNIFMGIAFVALASLPVSYIVMRAAIDNFSRSFETSVDGKTHRVESGSSITVKDNHSFTHIDFQTNRVQTSIVKADSHDIPYVSSLDDFDQAARKAYTKIACNTVQAAVAKHTEKPRFVDEKWYSDTMKASGSFLKNYCP